MLLLALAFSTAVAMPEQNRVRRPRIAKIPARSTPGSKTRSKNLCGAACATPAGARYRLPLPDNAVVDHKKEAVASSGLPCGTTGAPVCPSNGRQIVRTTLDD